MQVSDAGYCFVRGDGYKHSDVADDTVNAVNAAVSALEEVAVKMTALRKQ
jgi:hypothetical protein